MKLNETIEMMTSSNSKERFKAEYYQLKIRHEELIKMLKGYKQGTLNFKPDCSNELLLAQLLHTQLMYMECYKNVLEERAKIENIEL